MIWTVLVLAGGIWFGSHYVVSHRVPSPVKVTKTVAKATAHTVTKPVKFLVK